MKLFVAIPVDEDAEDRLVAMQEGLNGARWVPAENFHVTLAYIGEADRRLLEDVDSALGEIAGPAPLIEIAGAGAFGDAKPRAVWAGVVLNDDLAVLQSKVVQALSRAGANIDRRKFKPHVTIAYVGGIGRIGVEAWTAAHGLMRARPFRAAAFDLYASRPGASGSVYESLASYPLSSFSR